MRIPAWRSSSPPARDATRPTTTSPSACKLTQRLNSSRSSPRTPTSLAASSAPARRPSAPAPSGVGWSRPDPAGVGSAGGESEREESGMAVMASVFDETQRATLEALCDTFVPAVETSTQDPVEREFLARSAADLQVAAQMEGMLAEGMTPDE